jgi:IS30 family transposase
LLEVGLNDRFWRKTDIGRTLGLSPITASAGIVLLVNLLVSRRAFRRKAAVQLTIGPLLGAILATTGPGHGVEQIAGWLKSAHPGDEARQVSHETIYRSLFVQSRGVLKKELLQHVRSKRTIRRSKSAGANGDRRGQIADLVSIRERPAAVEDRAAPGHWEGDRLSGSKNSHIATLVERHTRYVMLVKVANKETKTVLSALIKQAKKLPTELYKSLTWDRGKELAAHRRFTLATNIAVYFCDPQSPWQQGSNENTNGPLRQYFPKGTDLSVHSQAHLNKVARQLNERPRETFAFQTPADRFSACVASIS